MNTFRIPFLVATDLLVLAMLIALLSGCATAPQLQYRNGDFVSHMAAVETDASEGRDTRASVRRLASAIRAAQVDIVELMRGYA